ncbi:putative 2-aminoethylphosphonate ABC transporter substrate-binding protein [Bacillus piscicola]|uniref:putative 2-aminoethylphosphonate ABC transporter substrate-binding protein n=1 Tax=Bacillus piscicola TaxID=1632684 RepID=UPI001F099286|nr:putative 2-aminoethylphosphonate ABC transporter substrate-binding protein [Bacillus piscicola]
MKKWLWITAAALLFVMAGCGGGGSEETVEGESGGDSGGGKPESVTVYTAIESDYLQDYLNTFKEEHPDIELDVVRDSSGIIVSRLLAEKDNPKADVIWGLSVDSLLLFEEEGMLTGYNPEGYEKLQERFADQKNDPMKWTGIAAYMTTFSVNTAEMERLGLPIPKSYEDLLDPQYKGLISMPNPASSGTGFLTVSGLLQLHDTEEEGWEYLDKLHENIGSYTHSGSKPAVQAGNGEYPIGISFDGRSVAQEESGAPLVTVFPEEGSGWTLEANALLEKENIKDSAKTFLDWANSESAMQGYNDQFAITGIELGNEPPDSYPDNPTEQLLENDLYWAAENRIEIVDTWVEKYDGKSEPEE